MSKPIIVIGAGGHAIVVIDAARTRSYPVTGVLDTEISVGSLINDVKVIGDDSLLVDQEFVSSHLFHVAIADPETRKSVAEKLAAIDCAEFATIRHASAVISSSADLSDGCFVNAGAVINASAEIGSHSIINTSCSVDHHARIGRFCHIAPGAVICGNVIVGEKTVIGPGAVVTRGIHIQDAVTVGAGSVVLRDIQSKSRVAGAPATRI